jgi:hypothetical protein
MNRIDSVAQSRGGGHPCSPSGTYADNEMNQRLGRVGLPYGTMPVDKSRNPSRHPNLTSCSPTGEYSPNVTENFMKKRARKGYANTRSKSPTDARSGVPTRTGDRRQSQAGPRVKTQRPAVIQEQSKRQEQSRTNNEVAKPKSYRKRLDKFKGDVDSILSKDLEGDELKRAVRCLTANAGSRAEREEACRAMDDRCIWENKRCRGRRNSEL